MIINSTALLKSHCSKINYYASKWKTNNSLKLSCSSSDTFGYPVWWFDRKQMTQEMYYSKIEHVNKRKINWIIDSVLDFKSSLEELFFSWIFFVSLIISLQNLKNKLSTWKEVFRHYFPHSIACGPIMIRCNLIRPIVLLFSIEPHCKILSYHYEQLDKQKDELMTNACRNLIFLSTGQISEHWYNRRPSF